MRGTRDFTRRATTGARRGAAGVLVLVLAGCWPAPGQGPDRTGHNPIEDTITPDTVATLAPIWTATTDGVDGRPAVVGPPVASYAGVHVRDAGGIYGFDAATGARLWRYPEDPVAIGQVGDPVTGAGQAYRPPAHEQRFEAGTRPQTGDRIAGGALLREHQVRHGRGRAVPDPIDREGGHFEPEGGCVRRHRDPEVRERYTEGSGVSPGDR